MNKRRPSRMDFERLSEDFATLAGRQAATQRELAIQFQRIADLQAEIDLMRAAWSKIRTKSTDGRPR